MPSYVATLGPNQSSGPTGFSPPQHAPAHTGTTEAAAAKKPAPWMKQAKTEAKKVPARLAPQLEPPSPPRLPAIGESDGCGESESREEEGDANSPLGEHEEG